MSSHPSQKSNLRDGAGHLEKDEDIVCSLPRGKEVGRNDQLAQKSVTKRQISNFLQSAAISFVDSMEAEVESATQGMRELIEFSLLWGVADDTGFTGDAYQYSGILPWIYNDDATNCVIDLDATIALTNLDAALDVTKFKYQNLVGGKWFFIASPQMISKIGALQTLVRMPVTKVEFEGGVTMDSYRGVPIVSSGFVAPSATGASVTSLAASPGGTGTVTNGLYRYKVAAITLYGEQVASASASGTMTSQAAMNLEWDTNANAKSYAIYRTNVGEADDDDNYDLLDIIAGNTYTAAGAVSTAGGNSTYTDAFTKTAKTTVHPLGTVSSTAEESLFLVYLDKLNGASLAILPPAMGDAYGNDPVRNLVRYNQLVESTSSFQFRLESFQALQIPDAKVCVAIRRAHRV